MLTLAQLLNPQTSTEWETTMLAQMAALGLPTTSWQPGDPERTIIAGMSQTAASEDATIRTFAAGANLGYAAAVTPDPSTNTSAAPGWLDVLGVNVFGVTRAPASVASTTLVITNTTGSTYGPFAGGTYHVASSVAGGPSYTNAVSLTIAPSTTTSVTIVADQIGVAGTSGAGTITQTVTSLTGVTCTNPVAAVGANAQSNALYQAACQAKLGTISVGGPSQAYQYFATQSNLTGYPTLAGGAITRVLRTADPSSGVVSLYLANGAGGPVSGDVSLMSAYLYSLAVPDGVTLNVYAAGDLPNTLVINLWLPPAYNAAVTANLNALLNLYYSTLAIGGETLPGGVTKGVPISQILAIALVAGAFGGPTIVASATATINGAATDLVTPAGEVNTLYSVTITCNPS